MPEDRVPQNRIRLAIPRDEILDSFAKDPRVELAIIGGGIHGACLAHFAAQQGVKVALFEKGDYAQETSGRSSKMAHGGLRYVELFDFEQVREGVKCREELLESAPHLCYPHPFFIPNPKSRLWNTLKFTLGLHIYDWFSRGAGRKHSSCSRRQSADFEEIFAESFHPLSGFRFYDGIMNDARIVLEHIREARKYAARCLNSCPVRSLRKKPHGWELEVESLFPHQGQRMSIEASYVMNCAGPWAGEAIGAWGDVLRERLVFSRGVHLIFSKVWKKDALLVPAGAQSQYYFIWPHPAGTLVGTTDHVCEFPEAEPMPHISEIEEILGRLARDVPKAGLGKENLVYAYAGIRNLPLRKGQTRKNSLRLSRRHEWCSTEDKLLSLLGGKFTSAVWTAEEGLRIFWEETKRRGNLPHFSSALVREDISSQAASRINALARSCGLTEQEQFAYVHRYGASLEGVNSEDDLAMLSPQDGIRAIDVKLGFSEEQALGLDDFLARRVQREYHQGHGLDAVPGIEESLKGWGIPYDEEQTEKYRRRVQETKVRLHFS